MDLEKTKNFPVVSFLDGEDVSISVFPVKWVTYIDNKPYGKWPVNTKNIRSIIKKNGDPGALVRLYPLKIIKEFENYEMALNYEKKYSLTSSESDIKDAGRGRRRKIINKNPDYTTDGDSSSSSIEPPDMPQSRSSCANTAPCNNKEITHAIKNKPKSNDNMLQSHSSCTNTAPCSTREITPSLKSIPEDVNNSLIFDIPSFQDIPASVEPNSSLVLNTISKEPSSESTVNPITIINDQGIIIDDNLSAVSGVSSEHLSVITKNIIELKYLYTQMSNKIDILCQKLEIRPLEPEEDIISAYLPLNTIKILEEFENILLTNESAKNQFKFLLVQIGGKDYKNCIRRILMKVFSNDLACLCSWTGAKGNYTIKNLCVVQIILDAVRKNFASLTTSSFEETLKEWFRYANQRKSRSQGVKAACID